MLIVASYFKIFLIIIMCHSHRPHSLVTGKNFCKNQTNFGQGDARKAPKKSSKVSSYSDDFPFIRVFLGVELWVPQSCLVPSSVTL